MPKRTSTSKKLRFEIFKRDSFSCQYCGRCPPVIVLECDHIIAVANGGKTEADNLITSCFDCNRGKGKTPLSVAPQSLKDRAADVAEREAQIKGYGEIMAAKNRRIDEEAGNVLYCMVCNIDEGADFNVSRDWVLSTKRFVEKLGYDETHKAMEIACAKVRHSQYRAFRYFCGICWGKIKAGSNG